MQERKRTVLLSVLSGFIAIAFLSLLIVFLALNIESNDSEEPREFNVLYEAYVEETGSHSAPELVAHKDEDITKYLRIRKTPVEKKPVQVVPTLPKAEVLPPPVINAEPEVIIVETPQIIEELPIVEEIAIIEEEPEEIIFEPVVEPVIEELIIEEPIVEEPVVYSPTTTYDDDFWADFFVQGEDELTFDSGYYYMELYVNEEYMGDIEVYMENEYVALSKAYLEAYTADYLTDEANKKVFEDTPDYMTVEELKVLGIDATIDTFDFKVYVTFSNDDMPWNVISVAGLDKKVTSRPIVGAEMLQKEPFAATSHVSASVSGTLRDKSSFNWNLSLSFANELSIYDYCLDFSFNIHARNSGISASFSGWKIYREFEEYQMRVDAGNVSTSMLTPYGTSFGISMKKDFSYAKVGTKRANVHESTILVETESNVIITNDDKKIFERTLKPGNYKLEDFVLISGLNTIVVSIEPLNGNEKTELVYEFSYASSLLAPGEQYYGVSIAFGREQLISKDLKRPGALSFKLGKKIYQYDIRNFAISGFYNVGLTKSITLNSSFAFSNTPEDSKNSFSQKTRLSLDLYAANPLGVLKTQANLALNSNSLPQISLKIGQQLPFESDYFRNLNLSFSYASPVANNSSHNFSLSASSSGKITSEVSWNGGLSLTYNTANISSSPYSLNVGLGWNPRSNISISANASLVGTSLNAAPKITARINGYISFGSAGSSNSAIDSYSTSLGYRVNKDNLSISTDFSMPGISNILKATPSDYNIEASIGSTFDAFSLSGNISSSLNADNIGISASASTNILYAGGAFGISASSASKYLMVKQEADLRNNILTISAPGASKDETPNRLLSSYLYTNLARGYLTSLELYSQNEQNAFLGMVNKTITIPADKRGAYVYTIKADRLYQVSGMVKIDDYVYSNESSPVYNVVEAEDGTISLDINNNFYMFTDQTGRFVLSDIKPGTYAFDIKDQNGKWNLIMMTISEEECSFERMNLYEINTEYTDGASLDYERIIKLDYSTSLSEDEYWTMVDAEWEAAL